MKYLLLLSIFFFYTEVAGQVDASKESTETIIIDNDKMKVVEFVSMPQGDVCGDGMHHHEPHLTVVLSDAMVRITSDNGESQTVEVPLGTSMWFESETHSVVNTGDSPTRMILVFLKN